MKYPIHILKYIKCFFQSIALNISIKLAFLVCPKLASGTHLKFELYLTVCGPRVLRVSSKLEISKYESRKKRGKETKIVRTIKLLRAISL